MKGIIEKIKKLLALANSSNEHEAKLAASMATEILTKHNLTRQQVDKSSRRYIHYGRDTGKYRRSAEGKFIFSLLRNYFFVEVIQQRIPVAGRIHRRLAWMFLGEPHNVEIAIYIYDFLERSFIELFKEYRKKTGSGVKARNSYYYGLYCGLADQLKAARHKAESSAGLVVVKDGEISKYAKDLFSNLKAGAKTEKMDLHDKEALMSGILDGKNIKIARGLGSSNEEKPEIGKVPLKLRGSNVG